MKKIIYVLLLLATLGCIGYIAFYIVAHQKPIQAPAPVATTTPEVVTPIIPVNKVTLSTQTQKAITVAETNPNGESISSIDITTDGFATNTLVHLETNKLTESHLIDLNKDGFDELVLTTMGQGSGSYGDTIIYTTKNDQELIPVDVPQVMEIDTQKGGLFEGYMGHDSFIFATNTLTRTFPTYAKNDTNDSPTGPTREVKYNLVEKNGAYSIVFSKVTPTKK